MPIGSTVSDDQHPTRTGTGFGADSVGAGVVLVVDDDAELRQVVCRALRAAGFVTIEAKDGSVGLNVLESLDGPPRCVLVVCDREMPVMDGPTMIAHLRARWDGDTLPVVLMSGSGGVLDGANGFLAKPFPVRRLITMAEQLTTHRI